MITDEQVQKALDYLGIDPHPIAVARYEMTLAENERQLKGAELTLATTGTVLERESEVETYPSYVDAKAKEAKATFEYERHRARVKSAETIIDLWRTEQANARAMEQVR